MRHNEHCRENEEAQLKRIAVLFHGLVEKWYLPGEHNFSARGQMGPIQNIKTTTMTICPFEHRRFPIAMATVGSNLWTQKKAATKTMTLVGFMALFHWYLMCMLVGGLGAMSSRLIHHEITHLITIKSP